MQLSRHKIDPRNYDKYEALLEVFRSLVGEFPHENRLQDILGLATAYLHLNMPGSACSTIHKHCSVPPDRITVPYLLIFGYPLHPIHFVTFEGLD